MVVPTIRVSHWDHMLIKQEREGEAADTGTKGKFA